MIYANLYKGIHEMNHVVKPIQMLRSDWLTEGHHICIGCLPKTTCKTCRKDTKGYADGMCESCAKAWTHAFYEIAEEHLGIRVIPTTERERPHD